MRRVDAYDLLQPVASVSTSDSFVEICMMNVVKENMFTPTEKITFILLTCFSFAMILFFIGYWFSFGDWYIHPGSFWVLTCIVFLRVAKSLARWFTLPFIARPRTMAPQNGLKVAVVTTFVPGSESLEMLEETVRALVALEYPHDTWVLDEGDEEEVKDLCRIAGARHFSRKNVSHYQTGSGRFKAHSKHGNYNAWLYQVGFDRYEIITAFDPDHVPDPSFLKHVLGYFEDPSIGYVQAPLAFYNQKASFIARGAAEETYDYCSSTQMAAYSLGQPAVVGCHNTHRVRALKEVGGFAAHNADDLLIGLLYQAHGWRGVYIPRILARGITPVDWNGYLTQQLRCSRAVIDVKCRLQQLVGRKISPTVWAISALDGLFYIQNSVTTLIAILLLAYMLVSGNVPKAVSFGALPHFILLWVAIKMLALYRQRFYLDPHREWGIHWRASLLRYAKWPVLIWALWDVAVGRRVPYTLTSKVKTESHTNKLFIPHSLVIVLLCGAACAGWLMGSRVPLLIYFLTAAVVVASILLIFTGYLYFPEPYERRLLREDAGC